jgi:hypothetical protein
LLVIKLDADTPQHYAKPDNPGTQCTFSAGYRAAARIGNKRGIRVAATAW